jgi:hypothetical protein
MPVEFKGIEYFERAIKNADNIYIPSKQEIESKKYKVSKKTRKKYLQAIDWMQSEMSDVDIKVNNTAVKDAFGKSLEYGGKSIMTEFDVIMDAKRNGIKPEELRSILSEILSKGGKKLELGKPDAKTKEAQQDREVYTNQRGVKNLNRYINSIYGLNKSRLKMDKVSEKYFEIKDAMGMIDETSREFIDKEYGIIANFSIAKDREDKMMAFSEVRYPKLESFLDDGFMIMPSIAVTQGTVKPKSNFGDIVFLMRKDAVDPQRPWNRVYDADSYSPRMPSVEKLRNSGRLNNPELELDTTLGYAYLTFSGDRAIEHDIDSAIRERPTADMTVPWLFFSKYTDYTPTGFGAMLREIVRASKGDEVKVQEVLDNFYSKKLMPFVNDWAWHDSISLPTAKDVIRIVNMRQDFLERLFSNMIKNSQ